MADEGAAHGVRAAEASGGGDLFESLVGLLEFTTRGFNAHVQDVVRRRDADLGLTAAAWPASSSTESRFCRFTAIQSWSSCSARIFEASAASEMLSWGWPPGRRRKSTSSRATSWAVVLPQSSSTQASARSMPAEMPAEV